MIWINNISQLQYYTNAAGAPCYCENLVYASDLILQVQYNYASPVNVLIEVYSADGLNLYEDATSFFELVNFTANNKQYYNLRLKAFSPAMCLYKCWILKVTLSDSNIVWQKWTQRYCKATCCDVPRVITFGETSPVSGVESSGFISVPAANCGNRLIRIEAIFPCFDNQLGDYYGIPSGANWGFKKITNIPGRIAERSREVIREISYNCNLQRAESFIPYLLESQTEDGIFPYWKKRELEAMFHCPEIIVSDFIDSNEYTFAGGVVTELINSFNQCWELFKLDTVIQTCTVRQVFGCGDCEIDAQKSLVFLIPQNYAGGNFYNENKQNIGGYADVLTWFGGQNLITAVEDISGDYDNVYAAFSVTGLSYIPTQIYFDTPTSRNRVFGIFAPSSPVIVCAMPVVGEIIITDEVCATPVIGTIVIEDVAVEEAAINDIGDWDVDEGVSSVELSGTFGRMNLTTFNPNLNSDTGTITQWFEIVAEEVDNFTVPITGSTAIVLLYASQSYTSVDWVQVGDVVTMNVVTFSPGELLTVGVQTAITVELADEVIGVISANGWPQVPYSVDLGDVNIVIDALGNIRYSGQPTTTDGTGSEIIITDLIYPLTS